MQGIQQRYAQPDENRPHGTAIPSRDYLGKDIPVPSMKSHGRDERTFRFSHTDGKKE